MEKVLGIDIGGTNIRVVRMNSQLEIEHRESAQMAEFQSQEDFLKGLAELVGQTDPNREAKKAGIGFPAPIVTGQSFLTDITNIPYLEGMSIEKLKEVLLGYELFLENDVNVIALLEASQGAAKGKNNIVYITVSTGIGSGVIINRDIYRGAGGYAGEIGSIIVSDQEPFTLEDLCSGKALEQAARKQYGENAGAKELFEAKKQGDSAAVRFLDQWLEWLSVGFAAVIQTLDPEMIVLGGPVIVHNPWVIGEVKNRIGGKLLGRLSERICLETAEFGLDAGVLGAGNLALLHGMIPV